MFFLFSLFLRHNFKWKEKKNLFKGSYVRHKHYSCYQRPALVLGLSVLINVTQDSAQSILQGGPFKFSTCNTSFFKPISNLTDQQYRDFCSLPYNDVMSKALHLERDWQHNVQSVRHPTSISIRLETRESSTT